MGIQAVKCELVTIAGPAALRMEGDGFCTLRLSSNSQSAPTDLSIGQFRVRLDIESSEDLSKWVPTSYSISTNLAKASFFRLRVTKLQ